MTMSQFEFFFTLYGLVLGLSVVEIVSGFARLAYNRSGVKVGVLVPMLAVLMLLDLANFWINAFERLQTYPLSYAILVIALLISSLYYIAASVVFPRDFSAEPDFDQVYFRHRRLVIGILVGTGIMAFELLPWLTVEGRTARWAFWSDPTQAWLPLTFFAAAIGIIVSRRKALNIACLGVLIAPYLYGFVSALPS
jgi:hypothetical protein